VANIDLSFQNCYDAGIFLSHISAAMDRTKAQAKVRQLVEKFRREQAAGVIGQYNESETKTGFIEPLLQGLGWNTQDRNEVGLEEKISGGRVDYSLKIKGSPKIYIEAKPPRTKLTKPQTTSQAITYGYNKRSVPWVLLTDFQELRLFDVTIRPNKRNLEAGLRLDLTYDRFIESFDDLWLLSKESVESSLLDRSLLSKKLDRLRRPVDKEILEDMKRWREILAKDIYKNHPDMTEDHLKDNVQRILDRIIFIRSCEDRGLTYGETLQEMVAQRRDDIGTAFMPTLKAVFRRYDRDFDSELFDQHTCEDLAIDFSALKEVILETYDPYLFDAIGVEVLGNIYEQYLGFVPRLTEKRVKYEPKPEVRKAGGIFYTPEYIVDYIVKNTLGRFLSERKPKQIQMLRILDPACGSGSFLIRAYREMEAYYQDLKKQAWEKRQKVLSKVYEDQSEFSFDEGSQESRWELNVFDKRKVVLNHLFGVDLDEQAVEVSRLSLMLKMLEREHGIIPGRAVLPTLDHNIKCGNSLISGDVLKLQSFFKEDWVKTKEFDWDVRFRKIVKEEGGFDIIIGNPPYVRIQTLPQDQVGFFSKNYVSATGNYDIYTLFVERGLRLLKPGGILGFILPHKFFQAAYGQGLRKLIAGQKALMEVVNFRDNQIFEEASTYTCLLFLQRGKERTFKYSEVAKLEDPEKQLQTIREHEEYYDDRMRIGKILKKQVSEAPWSFSFGEEAELLEKLGNIGTTLGDVSKRIFQGVITSADTVFLFKEFESVGKSKVKVYSKELQEKVVLEADILKRVVRSGDIGQYYAQPTCLVLFPYKIEKDQARLLLREEIESHYRLSWVYLKQCKKVLESREGGRFRDDEWYRFGRTQNIGMWEQPKILVPYMITRLSAYPDSENHYYFVNVTTGGYGILANDNKVSMSYLTALMNSRLLDFHLKKITTNFRGGYFAANKQYIEQLPIRIIDFSNPKEKMLHNGLVTLVDVMVDLRKRERAAKGHELELVNREIEKTAREIDERVYQLYGITERERELVEKICHL
jgi:type I restriction-modification system DNA methylase subunit